MSKKLTRAGHGRLKNEYEELLHHKRPKVVKGISDAAAEGDRSENAEYIYGKKHLREIDKRLQYLAFLLKEVQIIDPALQPSDRIRFGCTVKVQDGMMAAKSFKIVGEGETDFYESAISETAPIAQALLGKKVGDIVEIHRPKGLWEVEVIAIESKD